MYLKPIQLLFLSLLLITLSATCNNTSPNNVGRCITLANKIKTLYISPENIVSPKNTELPEGANIIDIYEIIEYLDNKTPYLQIDGKGLICKGKAKTFQDDYPVEFYVMIENRLEYIVVESQGKRKWIFKWKASDDGF